jgi:hypothetical protein
MNLRLVGVKRIDHIPAPTAKMRASKSSVPSPLVLTPFVTTFTFSLNFHFQPLTSGDALL